MTDVAKITPPSDPRPRWSAVSFFLPPLLFLWATLMAADSLTVSLAPLRMLQIPYPWWINYSHLLIAGACASVWLLSLLKCPNAGAIVSVLLCLSLLPLISWYADTQVAKLPVTRRIDINELLLIQATVGVPVIQQGSRDETFVIVALANEQLVCTELERLKLLGGSSGE